MKTYLRVDELPASFTGSPNCQRGVCFCK